MTTQACTVSLRCSMLLLVALTALTEDVSAQSTRRRAVRIPSTPVSPPAQSHVLRFFERGIEQDEEQEPAPTRIDGTLTIEAWIRLDALTASPRIVNLSDPGGTWVAGISVTDQGRWLFHTRNGSVESPAAAHLGKWTHVAGRATPSALEILLDGVLVETRPLVTPVSIPQARFALGVELKGSMRQVRVWRAALSDADVKRYAMVPPVPADPSLVAWWPLDDGAIAGRLTRSIRDLGSLGITFGPPFFQGRWVRVEILDSGPYFKATSMQPAGSTSQDAGLPFGRFIDFDHDGDLDVYTVHRMRSPCAVGFPYFQGTPPQPDRAFRNEGAGPIVDASDEILLGDRIQGFLVHSTGVADFTGDGLTDIFVTENGPECGETLEESAYPNSIRVGTSTGRLENQSRTRVPQIFDIDHRSAFGDIDGDGDLDAVSATVEGDLVRFYVNDGSGGFSAETNRTPATGRALTSVAMIDADLDGDLDLFGGDNLRNVTNVLMLNDGTGHYTTAPAAWLPAKERGAKIATVHTMPPVDLNGDGLLDLIASEQGIGFVGTEEVEPFLQLLLGNGDGSFRDGSSSIPQDWGSGPAGFPFGASVFVLESFEQNGDGWTDLAIPAVGPDYDLGPPTLLINRGSAGFEEAGDLLPSDRMNAFVAVGDAERDGDDDLVYDLLYMENLAPYRPNAFPAADLRIEMALTEGTTLVQSATAVNGGMATAAQITMAIPVPHGFTWSQMSDGGGSCLLDRHVAVCTLPSLAAGGRWTVSVTSQKSADPPATFAVASVTGDVNDPDRTNNRVRLPLK